MPGLVNWVGYLYAVADAGLIVLGPMSGGGVYTASSCFKIDIFGKHHDDFLVVEGVHGLRQFKFGTLA